MATDLTRRQFIGRGGTAALAAAGSSTLISACTSANDSGNGTEISLWAEQEGSRDRKYWKNEVKKKFEKKYPKITLDLTFESSDDLEKNLRTALRSRRGPDIVPTPGTSYALKYVNADMLQDLGKFNKEHQFDKKINSWALEAGKKNGKLYSLPAELETMALFYNKTLFKKHNWDVPKDVDDLEALAKEAKGKGITPFAAGNSDWRPGIEWFISVFLNHYAGPKAVYSALTGDTPWSDPVFVDALNLLKRYFKKGWISGGVQQYYGTSGDEAREQLASRKAAMDIEGTWLIFTIDDFFGKAESKDEWDWVSIPSLSKHAPNDVYELGVGSTLSLNKHSDKQDEGANYLKWYFDNPSHGTYWSKSIPAVIKPESDSHKELPDTMDKRVRRLIDGLLGSTDNVTFGYTTWTFFSNKSDEYVYDKFPDVLAGKMKTESYCEELDKIFKKDFKADNVPQALKPK